MKSLTKSEATEYKKLDEIIRTGAKTFMEVGSALVAMHEDKLYRDDFGTFEAYCKSRGIQRRQAYKLMTSVQMSFELKNEPSARSLAGSSLQTLAQIPADKRKDVLRTAAKRSGGAPTQQAIIDAQAEVLPQPLCKVCEVTFSNPIIEEQVEILRSETAIAAAELMAPPCPQEKLPKMTPLRFLDELLTLESRIPADTAQPERCKYGVHANALAERLMNPVKKTTSAYTR